MLRLLRTMYENGSGSYVLQRDISIYLIGRSREAQIGWDIESSMAGLERSSVLA
jgi:hypothetical protein